MSERRILVPVKGAAGRRHARGEVHRLLERALVGAALLLAMLIVGVQLAKATSMLPS